MSIYQNPEAERLLEEAKEIDALVGRISTNRQWSMLGIMFYHPVEDEEAIQAAEQLLGRQWQLGDAVMDLFSFNEFVKNVITESVTRYAEALKPKPYPVLICGGCKKVTGWKNSMSRCENCEDKFLVDRNRENIPSVMFGNGLKTINRIMSRDRKFPELVEPNVDHEKVSLRARTSLLLRISNESYEQEQKELWHKVVDLPGLGNVPEPFIGAVWDVPVKHTQESTRDNEPLVRFGAIPYEWTGKKWKRRSDLRCRPLPCHFPTTFSQNIENETIEAAWKDFCLIIHSSNIELWGEPRIAKNGEKVIISAKMGETNTRIIGNKRHTAHISSDGKSTSLTIE